MSKQVNTAQLRRLWHKSEDPSVVGMDWANARHAMHDQFLALLDELETAREEAKELRADYQRLEEIRRDLMERCERMRSMEGLPLDEIAARQIARAAAELIRAGGWRPIAEAPESKWLFVGKHALGEWYPATLKKSWAIANGYTHYLPEPEPPAREVPDERG